MLVDVRMRGTHQSSGMPYRDLLASPSGITMVMRSSADVYTACVHTFKYKRHSTCSIYL